jgi:hypothetical protein
MNKMKRNKFSLNLSLDKNYYRLVLSKTFFIRYNLNNFSTCQKNKSFLPFDNGEIRAK